MTVMAIFRMEKSIPCPISIFNAIGTINESTMTMKQGPKTLFKYCLNFSLIGGRVMYNVAI